jgi:hypothetical protein
MKERLVRGNNLASVLRVLKSQRRLRPLPELGDWEKDLLQRRIAPSTWYALKVFDSFLQVVHRFVFDGSEAAAQNMGQQHAIARVLSHPGLIVAGDPVETLSRFPARWAEQYNFGQVEVSSLPPVGRRHGVRIRITAYPDMSACHGHSIMGFTRELAKQAGASDPELSLEERPWMHNSLLSFTLSWTQ